MNRLRSVPLVSLLCFCLPSQEPVKPVARPKPAPQEQVKPEQEAKGSETPDGDAPGVGAKAETRSETPVFGARGYCRIETSVRPSKLMPGQTGKALLTMILEGDAVLTAPAVVDLQLIGHEGPLSFGPASFSPPERGRLAKAFLGQPVYDNWAIIEMPVTMGQGLPLGSKQNAGLALTFELVNGKTGQPIGKFTDRAFFVIEVGASSDPFVQFPTQQDVTPRQGQEPPEGQEAGKAAIPSSQQGGRSRDSLPVAEVQSTPESRLTGQQLQEPSPASSIPDPAHPRPEGSQTTLLILFGGAVLLLIVVLALVRRR